MFRKHEMIPSRHMDRPMHLWRFGHFGKPILVLPSASGMAHEWDAHGVIEAIGDLIDGGVVKLYCTESNVAEAWTRRENPMAWRIQRHLAFERFVTDELVPYIRHDCRSATMPVGVTGTSLGACFSANFALKYPESFDWALCLSGRYDTSWLTDGYTSDDVYYNNPMAFVPGLDGDVLERIRRHTHLVLVCGRGKWEDGNVDETIALADMLAAKNVSHERDIWGPDVSHEWPWWRRQVRYHLLKAFGGRAG